jgi:tetratricopeptide (TPR) repeat protein
MTGAAAERAAFCRRRAEELWHSGRHQEALGFARLAFDLQPRDAETVRFCAWLFSNGQDHAAAGAAYERLLALSPEWIAGHRHASGSFAMIGELERAIFHARQASDRDPLSDEFARHAGGLLEQAGRPAEAAFYLARAAALSPGDGALLRRLSAALWAAGARDKAVALAWQAWRCDSEDRESAHHAAELLLRCGRCEEATLLLGETIRAHPADHAALRKLSAAEMLRADPAAALAAIDQALLLSPQTAEYHIHRAGLLRRLGDCAAAAEAYGARNWQPIAMPAASTRRCPSAAS